MNVFLRPVELADIEQLRQWRNSENIRTVSISNEYITTEMQVNWFNKIKDEKNGLFWIVMNDAKPVGFASVRKIDYTNLTCEFANLYLGEAGNEGSGLGAMIEFLVIDYVFNNLQNIRKINCEILSNNPKVIQMIRKFGFIEEGILRKQYVKDNVDLDLHLLAIFKDVWNNNKDKLKKMLFR
ncbi:UDP-4-amino-4,6-dideoxy-N-acetyl-beta-L-altrosamine N-acetyltransferase [Danxiaibacter flavus]|uniref:UDP-4-amino-4, 6-dideoxy-N-acetyl-beta-L-altrosamine N-acetyltransferase n=1 Tax=Danxiaibacter flavus TaxID=3049108 RepID=A0ABV3ZEZ6_9BACT|nr:UDP-4-amino-4,6-dideoxy-N-acetyl-beta-L-altrosamine N-acetyltransferase [Chitinophagaceae bacterium DXS]